MVDLDPTLLVRSYIHSLYADADDPTCGSRYLLLVIHPNVDDLRGAGTAYERRRNRKVNHRAALDYGTVGEADGLWQPAPSQSRYDRRKKAWVDSTPAFLGVMRLAQGHLSPEVVAHECVHAALTLARRHDWAQPDGEGNANFGADCDDSEEAFAYSLSRLIDAANAIVDEACERMGVTRA